MYKHEPADRIFNFNNSTLFVLPYFIWVSVHDVLVNGVNRVQKNIFATGTFLVLILQMNEVINARVP